MDRTLILKLLKIYHKWLSSSLLVHTDTESPLVFQQRLSTVMQTTARLSGSFGNLQQQYSVGGGGSGSADNVNLARHSTVMSSVDARRGLKVLEKFCRKKYGVEVAGGQFLVVMLYLALWLTASRKTTMRISKMTSFNVSG